jgi:hypothetical protein
VQVRGIIMTESEPRSHSEPIMNECPKNSARAEFAFSCWTLWYFQNTLCILKTRCTDGRAIESSIEVSSCPFHPHVAPKIIGGYPVA